MKDNRLVALRNEIDKINFQILDLLNQRAAIALELTEEKAKAGINGFLLVMQLSVSFLNTFFK